MALILSYVVGFGSICAIADPCPSWVRVISQVMVAMVVVWLFG